MLTSRSVEPPSGTFIAKVRGGAICLPPLLHRYCSAMRWTLFRVAVVDADRLFIQPVMPGDDSALPAGFHSSLSSEGELWIPAALREAVSLKEQSVMMRVEDGGINIYLRKVFKTLGFGP